MPSEEFFVFLIPHEKLKKKYIPYRVRKGDTLSKVSLKFYGTTKRLGEIYEENKDKIENLEKISLGLILNIPTE